MKDSEDLKMSSTYYFRQLGITAIIIADTREPFPPIVHDNNLFIRDIYILFASHAKCATNHTRSVWHELFHLHVERGGFRAKLSYFSKSIYCEPAWIQLENFCSDNVDYQPMIWDQSRSIYRREIKFQMKSSNLYYEFYDY